MENNKAVMIRSMEDAKTAAVAMSASGYFKDAKDKSQALTKILAGQEMGVGAFAAMNDIHVIQGKPSAGAGIIAARVRGHENYDYDILEMSMEKCSVQVWRKSRTGEWKIEGVSTFTKEDAIQAQLWGKDNWKKYPRNMLFSRAISNAHACIANRS